MSQNRQDQKDRLRSELDFDVNRRAESEIQSLSRRMGLLMDRMEDVARQTAGLTGTTEHRSGSDERS
jgi:CRP/FNR family transcriptional regulator, cyclic AMP receptor protein